MSDIAIQLEGLSKSYQIGSANQIHRNFRDVLADAVTAPLRRTAQLLRGQAYGASDLSETIWALKDVCFDIKRGEAVGIVGRNGAGKSTLLKILARITSPTEGQAKVYGRVGALLEVGTGFHPELTGRENIYLNAAILGMSRAEIDRKFDEMVAFAEVEKFIDTPVKHYSSGMALRLGFAVAAHLEPEILIVDEVLAVGDVAFQRKCLGKMGSVANEGRTVLLVSHNMLAVNQLCERCIWLDSGHVEGLGRTDTILYDYSRRFAPTISFDSSSAQRTGNGRARFISVKLSDSQGQETNVFYMNSPLVIDLVIESAETTSLSTALIINDRYNQTLIHAVNQDDHLYIQATNGIIRLQVTFRNIQLYPGEYYLGVWCGDRSESYDYIFNCLPFSVEQGQVSGRTDQMVYGKALFYMASNWKQV